MKQTFIATLLTCYLTVIYGQDQQLLNKPGIFEVLGRTDYTLPECGFQKNELIANLQKINEVINVVRRKNPVLTDIKGFDGRARIYNISCREEERYGVPSRISFEFCEFFRDNSGTIVRSTIEPPEWSMILNKMVPITGWQFSSDRFAEGVDYFTIPKKKETVEPGIDVYEGENFVLYDSKRPPYWLPVTIEEAFAYVKEAWKKNPNKVTSEMMLKLIDNEYAALPTADLKKQAYFGGGVSRVTNDSSFPQIMRVNPDYWDKSRPKSDIQFMYFRWVMKNGFYTKEKEDCLRYNSTCYLNKFQEGFDLEDVRGLQKLVIKK